MGSVTDIDAETIQAARAFLQKVSNQFDMVGARLFGSRLFGSRARKSHRPDSDADVAVLLHGSPGKFVETKLAMADLAYDVLLETGIRIQPLPIREEEWQHPEAYSNPRLLNNIKNAREDIGGLSKEDFLQDGKTQRAVIESKAWASTMRSQSRASSLPRGHPPAPAFSPTRPLNATTIPH